MNEGLLTMDRLKSCYINLKKYSDQLNKDYPKLMREDFSVKASTHLPAVPIMMASGRLIRKMERVEYMIKIKEGIRLLFGY